MADGLDQRVYLKRQIRCLWAEKAGWRIGGLGSLWDQVTVHIVYMESQAQSNPTLCERQKYHGIGRALIAYGIKLSVEAGFNGDVTLDAKTPELARHYERDFGALLIPGRERGAAPRYLICDEAARDIFVSYLEED